MKSYYSADAILLPPNMSSANTPASIVAALKTFPPITSMTLHTEEVVAGASAEEGGEKVRV